MLTPAVALAKLSIPPTAEGPGIILPDSPLFFLDELKQNVRLFLAFTPEAKAKIHTAVAGERLAELQFMLAKDNRGGIRTALAGVSDNLQKAAEDLALAKLQGKNIQLLAKTTNDSIKDKQSKLSFLENQAGGELRAQVQATKEALKVAKRDVENYLPADLLANEVQDDLRLEVEDGLNRASISAKGLTHAIDALNKLASQANQQGALAEAEKESDKLTEAVSGERTFQQKLNQMQNQSVAGASTSSQIENTNSSGNVTVFPH